MRKTSIIESELARNSKFQKCYENLNQEQLLKLQDGLRNVLADFDKICKENNIYYSVCGGTLIGAIRHKGFIPWDDDIDVVVYRKDYNRIEEAIKNSKLSKEYTYILPANSTSVNFDAKFMSRKVSLGTLLNDNGIGYPLYLDVLPIDNVPDSTFEKLFRGILVNLLSLSLASQRCLKKNDELLNIMSKYNKELYINLLVRKLVAFPTMLLGYKFTTKIIEKLLTCSQNDTRYVTLGLGVLHYFGEIVPRKTFSESRTAKFDNIEVEIPLDSETYLRNRYGNYMELPPIEERKVKGFRRREDWKNIYKKERRL